MVLPQRELSVLSKISPFVKDSKQSAILIGVLLPLLSSSQKEETANNILKTVKSLLANVDRPKDFVTPLSKLFSQMSTRSTRKCLCDVFLELANVDSSFSSDACEILSRLNAWNAKRLEEPDYDARLEGFANAKQLVQQDALKTDEILPLLHNCIYFVFCSDDLSIRDSAGSCMSCIVRYVVQRSGMKDERFHVLIMKCLLPACRKALSSKKEVHSCKIPFIMFRTSDLPITHYIIQWRSIIIHYKRCQIIRYFLFQQLSLSVNVYRKIILTNLYQFPSTVCKERVPRCAFYDGS